MPLNNRIVLYIDQWKTGYKMVLLGPRNESGRRDQVVREISDDSIMRLMVEVVDSMLKELHTGISKYSEDDFDPKDWDMNEINKES